MLIAKNTLFIRWKKGCYSLNCILYRKAASTKRDDAIKSVTSHPRNNKAATHVSFIGNQIQFLQSWSCWTSDLRAYLPSSITRFFILLVEERRNSLLLKIYLPILMFYSYRTIARFILRLFLELTAYLTFSLVIYINIGYKLNLW